MMPCWEKPMNDDRLDKTEAKSLLTIAIDKYLKRIAPWLLKRFPEGKSNYFLRDYEVGGIRLYFFARFGFNPSPKLKFSKEEVGTGFRIIRPEEVTVKIKNKPQALNN